MNIHALQTGTATLKRAYLHAQSGVRGRLKLLLPGEWEAPVPIHAWLIEHDGQRILIDTGETDQVKNLPFARYTVTARDELPHALARLGLNTQDLDTVVVTHSHSDHIDGTRHIHGPVLIFEDEWRYAHSLPGRIAQRIARAPLPEGVNFKTFDLDDGPFGSFPASRRLTDDGRVVAVATPGHTPGHVSVIAVDDEGRHVIIAGDVTDSLEQLHARRPDAISGDPRVLIETIDRALDHSRNHPSIYLPSHDPQSAARLAAGTLV